MRYRGKRHKFNWFNFFVLVWMIWCVILVLFKNSESKKPQPISQPYNCEDVCGIEFDIVDLSLELPEIDFEPYFPISNSDREIIEYIVSGEAGYESLEGKMAVAQCILNAMKQDEFTASEVRKIYKYAGWKTDLENENPEMWEEVCEAVERVFDNGEKVTEENILWFYAPRWMKNGISKWHETQKYCGTWGTQKFFAHIIKGGLTMHTKIDIMQGNLFIDCSLAELKILWQGYIQANYVKGWYEEDNPLTPYKERYIEEFGCLGLMQTEIDLLRAIAFKTFEN